MLLKNSTLSFQWLGRQLTLILVLSIAILQSAYGQCSMSCSDNIQISLNQNCEAEVTYRMILRDPDNPYLCTPNGPSAYKVVVMDEEGVEIPTSPIITCEYVGRTLKVKVKHWYSGNSCWSTVIVEDKLPPLLNVPAIQMWCNQNPAPVSEGGVVTDPTLTDACAETCQNITLEYEDKIINYTCEDGEYQEGITSYIERSWTACDGFGNCRTQIQYITNRVPDFSQIDYPSSLVGENALICGTCEPKDLACTGEPTLHHANFEEALCHLETTYQDSITIQCVGTYTIERMWAIRNTCTDDVKHYTQLIEMVDKTAPTISCANGTTAVVAQTDPTPFSCVSSVIVPPAIIVDDCVGEDHITVITKVYKLDETGKRWWVKTEESNGGFELDMPFGHYEIYYQATDACGNTSNNNDTPCQLEIKDEVTPTPVCNALTKLALDGTGNGTIFAKSFDNGSYDNCCLEKFEVRRMEEEDGEFGEFVSFTCEDASQGGQLLVILRVHDCNGNFADCMVEVLIDDKAPPTITTCPEPVQLTCSDTLTIEQVRTTLLTQPIAEDLCSSLSYDVVLKNDFRNECGIGALIFEWQIRDGSGNMTTCDQLVGYIDDTPIEVTFPGDFIKFICLPLNELTPEVTGMPEIAGKDCEEVEILFSDSEILGNPACTEFTRTWVVTNLCPREDEVATVEHIQMISIKDIDAPVFECEEKIFTICLDGGVCEKSFDIAGVAVTDCSEQLNVSASWTFIPHVTCLGEEQIGIVEDAANGFVSPAFGPGQLVVTFIATDGCENSAACVRIYTINDCEAPEVYCLPGLTLNLDETGNIEVWANDFNQEVIDNCEECPFEYIFSFTQDVTNTSVAYDCEDLGLKTTQIWVTDAFGNQDLCTVTFIIKGADICDSLGMNTTTTTTVESDGMAGIAGQIYKEDGDAVELVNVMAENHRAEMMDMSQTDVNGAYAFEFARSSNVIVNPTKDDDILNGVTTFDILQMRKHILGFASLDSPYKIIAADINHSNSVTTADIVALRRAILQIDDNFKNNTSWRFIEAGHKFENEENPFAGEMPEIVTIPELVEEMSIDFIAIKVGDLNGNAVGGQFSNPNAESRSSEIVTLNIGEKELKAGQVETLTFSLDKTDIQGIQFTLNFDPSLLEIIEIPTTNQVSEANFGTRFIERGALTMSWDVAENRNEQLTFKLKIRANSAVAVSELFTINSQFTKAEAYDAKGLLHEVGLAITKSKYDYTLLQNEPNPFNQATTIRFSLPAKSQGKLTIFDITGQTLKSVEKAFVKGQNELIINDVQQRGVLYYQLETDFGTKTQKMIRVE